MHLPVLLSYMPFAFQEELLTIVVRHNRYLSISHRRIFPGMIPGRPSVDYFLLIYFLELHRYFLIVSWCNVLEVMREVSAHSSTNCMPRRCNCSVWVGFI